ncbi:MAG TPA: pitrilysin family protein [Vicinamibacterales bacterium]
MMNAQLPTAGSNGAYSRLLRRSGAGMLAVLLCGALLGAQVDRMPDGRFVLWPTERPPRPLSARDVKFPPYEVRTLQNGMQVIAVLHHEQPAVSMRLLVRTGSVQDPPGKVGVASLAAALLDQGTTTKSAEQIADEIDFIGGALGTGSGSDLTFVNVIVMKDSFGVGMNMLSDVVRNPAFAAEEIERQKQQAISSLQVSGNDPDYIASVLFERLVYGFHPYGLPNSGTPETLAGITRADLQEYHRRHFVPNNMVLAVVGDVTSDEAFAAAERVFDGWPRAEVPAVKVVDPPQPTRRVVVVDKPDAVQTEIRVGQLAIPRKHPDYMAFDLAMKILGGEGANRLHRVLRSERGLTYGAQADAETRKQSGHFVAETNTRTETTGETLRLTLEEVSRLQRERVFERELSDAQAYLAGSFPLTIETPNDIATQVLNVVFYELPVEEIGTFRERVQAVTPDDIQRVARQYVRADRLSIVLVGDASTFVPQLRRVGFSDVEIIPIQDLDLMSATLRRETRRAQTNEPFGPFGSFKPFESFESFRSRQLAYTRSQVNPNVSNAPNVPSDPNASAVLKRVIDAKGGLDVLKKVRTVVAEADTTFHMSDQPLASSTRTYVVYPDKFRVDATVAGAEVVQVYNGGHAWARDPGGVHEAPPGMRDDFAASVRRDMIPMLVAAAEGRLAMRLLPEEGGGGQVLKVLEISGAQLPPVKLYVDAGALVVRQIFQTPGPDGRPIEAEELFFDYRAVDGVQVPFRADVRRSGNLILSRTLTKVAFNTPLDDKLFIKPQ